MAHRLNHTHTDRETDRDRETERDNIPVLLSMPSMSQKQMFEEEGTIHNSNNRPHPNNLKH